MFLIKKEERTSKKMFLLNPTTVKTRRDFRNLLEVTIDACWESTASRTKGAVVLGKARFWIDTPQTLTSIEDIQNFMDYQPEKVTFRKDADMLLGTAVVWGGGSRNTIPLLEELIKISKVFPTIPDGWDGWYIMRDN